MAETISKDFWAKYQKQVGSGKVSSSLPYAFSHIVELSQLPDEAAFEVVFNDKTIDEAAEQATEILGYGEYDEEEDEDFQPVYGFDDVADDEIESILNNDPELEPTDDDDEVQKLLDEADAIIEFSEATGADPMEIVDAMAGVPEEDEDFQPIYGPFEPEDLTYTGSGKAGLHSELVDEDSLGEAHIGYLNNLLDLDDNQILFYIDQALNDNIVSAESVIRWVQENQALYSTVSTRYNLGQGALALASGSVVLPDPEELTGTDSDQSSAAEAAKAGGTMLGGPSETVNKELDKIYFETTGALPDDRADEAETLFWLYKHGEIGSQVGNIEKVGSLYRPFLADYINNRYKYTSGPDFDALIRRLSEELTKGPDGTGYSTHMQGYFGGDDKDKGDSKRRNILIKLYKTGSSYGPSEMHPGIETGMAQWKLMGKSPSEIFAIYTGPRYIPQGIDGDQEFISGDNADYEDMFGDDTTLAYDYDMLGIRDPALSFTPELYSPGIQRFGIPGETMATRHPRFREDPFQPPPIVYDRTGMRDPALSMTPELTGSPDNPFGDSLGWRNQWPYDPMAIPGINAAALPTSAPDPVDVAAYLESQDRRPIWEKMGIPKDYFLKSSAALGEGEKFDTGSFTRADTRTDIGTAYGYNEEEEKKRKAGQPYRTGRWIGLDEDGVKATKHAFEAKSAEDKKKIMADPTVWKMGPMHG